MARRMEDIIPGDRRSIHDVPVHVGQKARGSSGKIQNEPIKKHADLGKHVHISKIKSDDDEPVSSHQTVLTETDRVSKEKPKRPYRRPTGMRWFLLVIGVVVIFAGAGYIASVYFARATFTITPKNVSLEINSTYLAQDTTQNLVAASGTIPYSFMTVRGTASTTVQATPGPAISTKAQGVVTIYNSFSAQSQRLVAGTRFVNTSGKVYRLSGSLVVPGYTTSSKGTVPGSINATIVADQPGEAYNITGSGSVSDFKIVAYKGSPKYDTIYARQTNQILGGMVGTKSIINPLILASSTTELKARIVSDLIKQIHATMPTGYIMYDTGYVASFSTTTSALDDKTHALLNVQGVVSGMIFKKVDLVNRLVGPTALATFGQFRYDTSGLDSLNVQIVSTKASSKQIISMKIKGPLKLIGTVPTDEIISKILGKTSLEAESVLAQYAKVIENADGEVMPPWSKIPTSPSRISFKIKTI